MRDGELHGKDAEQEKHLHLTDGAGKQLSVVLRKYRPGEEVGMISCIRDEYGGSYFKKSFYLPEQIRKESDSGHITFLVAEDSETGRIAGMMILKEFFPEESMCEIASQIFRKKYRGYGLAQQFFIYGMEILMSRNYSAAYCLPVLFHDITQRLLYRQGLRATGFILNVFHMERISHSYPRDRNKKHSQGIQIMAVGKKNAGTLYLPPEHKDFCKKIYHVLGVSYRLPEVKRWMADHMENEKPAGILALTDMQWKQDEVQCSLEIRIHKVGRDLSKQIRELHNRYPLIGMQTANVFLNINDKNAVWAYRTLVKEGYFFAGLKPLCSDKEYMVLHNAGEIEIFWDDYVMTEEFKELANYVKKENGGKRYE